MVLLPVLTTGSKDYWNWQNCLVAIFRTRKKQGHFFWIIRTSCTLNFIAIFNFSLFPFILLPLILVFPCCMTGKPMPVILSELPSYCMLIFQEVQMFPYVPYLYPLMLLLCKQKIVFPLPSVSGEKDTALRSFYVLLINGVCGQPGWSLFYLVSITTIPRYFLLAFVLYLLSPPLIFIRPGFSFQLLSLMK